VVLKRLLIVEDERETAENLKKLCEFEGFAVDTAYDLKTAVEKFKRHRYPLVILDLKLPDGCGVELLDYVNPKETKVIVLTAHGTVETAVSSLKRGAFEYLQKPINFKLLLKYLNRALEELGKLSEEDNPQGVLKELVGNSPFVRKLRETLPQIAAENKNVLIRGEEGVGKTFVGTLIHRLSPRREFKLVKVTVGGKSEAKLEAELFGSTLGGKEKPGAFEIASGGTVILVGIEHMPPRLQKKLNEVLESKSFYSIGDNLRKRFNSRIISTTSVNLYEMAQRGEFNRDLLFKLGQIDIEIPPLRERREDIIPLLNYFIEKLAAEQGYAKPILSDEVVDYLKNYNFPANVRELKNLAERLVLLFKGKIVNISDLGLGPKGDGESLFAPNKTWREAKREFEKEYLKRALIEEGGNIRRVAEKIKLDISNVYRKIKEYGLERYVKK
jgi:DNA-binding NtrC family response regulator